MDLNLETEKVHETQSKDDASLQKQTDGDDRKALAVGNPLNRNTYQWPGV